jgi:hypothetical protein
LAVRTTKRFIASTKSPSIAPTFLASSGVGSTVRRDFGGSSIWQLFDSSSSTQQFFDSAVLRLSSSSTWQFSKCADDCRRAKKLPETTSRDF